MKYFKNFGVAYLVFQSTFAAADVYLNALSQTLKVETGLRRTTGIWGKLTGHFSLADELRLIRETKVDFRRSYPDYSGMTLLPVQVAYGAVTVSEPFSGSRENFWGRKITDEYRSFSRQATLAVPFLSDQARPPAGVDPMLHTSARLTSVKFLVFSDQTALAELELSDVASVLAEISFDFDDQRAENELTLSPSLRSAIGAKFGGQSPGRFAERATLWLETNADDGQKLLILLKKWERYHDAEFKRFFYRSVTRFVSPSFYSARCAPQLR